METMTLDAAGGFGEIRVDYTDDRTRVYLNQSGTVVALTGGQLRALVCHLEDDPEMFDGPDTDRAEPVRDDTRSVEGLIDNDGFFWKYIGWGEYRFEEEETEHSIRRRYGIREFVYEDAA